MKTLISTLSISAALPAPVATFAATTAQPTATPTTPVAARAAASQEKTNPSRVAMNEQDDESFGKQANDDRQGLARTLEQSRQLGATN